MMNKSKIDWCDFSWNPVTGCHNTCEYCYARKQAWRFSGDVRLNKSSGKIKQWLPDSPDETHGEILYTLPEPFKTEAGSTLQFPTGFAPTLHEYRLQMPAQKKKPANIFVCSMADLFGDWVPDEWIEKVFSTCEAVPWHNYLFLTKNPNRYCDLANSGKLPKHDNWWYGTTVTNKGQRIFGGGISYNTFISVEPLKECLDVGLGSFGGARWIIVGAETGNSVNKVKPEKEWIENVIEAAKITQTAVLLKDSKEMREVWGDDLIQEFPPELKHEEAPIPHCSECEHHKSNERHYDSVKKTTAMNHFCTAQLATKKIPGRYARTSPPWCPKRRKEE